MRRSADMIAAVCDHFGVDVDELLFQKTSTQRVVRARWSCYVLLRAKGLSYNEIAVTMRMTGGPSVVVYGLRHISQDDIDETLALGRRIGWFVRPELFVVAQAAGRGS